MYGPLVRIALFSDVHSNLRALEAVLDDIAGLGVDARYVPRIWFHQYDWTIAIDEPGDAG